MSVVDFRAPSFPTSAVVSNVRREGAALAAQRRDVGYADGYQAGLAAAQAEVDGAIADHRNNAERLSRCVQAFEAATNDLRQRDAATLADLEADLMTIAIELAAGLLGRELEHTEQPVLDALARALELKPDRGTPVIRVNPAEEHTAREAAEADLIRWGSETKVVADPSVARGGCVVDVNGCRIDAQLESAIERLRREA